VSLPEPVAASAPARVLFVEGNTDGTVGGSYFSLLFLVKGLDRTRYEPIVVFQRAHSLLPQFEATSTVALVDKPAPFHIGVLKTPAARRLGPLLLPLRLVQSGVNALRFVGTCLRYRRVLREQRADLLHLNNSITRMHDWMLAARLAGIPCVVHERGINDRFPFPTRQLTPGLAAVFCISQAVYDNLRRQDFAETNLRVVPNGLDPAEVAPQRTPADVRAALGIAPGAATLAMVGNLRAWKGQESVVRALPAVVRRVPSVVCVFVGSGVKGDSYVDRLHGLVSELGLTDHVIFTGHQDRPSDIVNIADIAIHASITPEPFGRVLLEAMALRKPVVGARGGAVTEIVVDGVTGATFPPGDSDALAASLIELLEAPDLARRQGEAGYERLVSTFHVRTNVARTVAIYEDALGSAPATQ
jgi:glycosyltransferase involved in cell wall biosynthesis